jgi:hypothetical protein
MSSKELPFIKDKEGILEEWKRRGSLLQAVFIGANVGLTFTGRLVNTGCAELRIARDEDELSINLLTRLQLSSGVGRLNASTTRIDGGSDGENYRNRRRLL